MITTVQIRILADSEADAHAAIEELRNAVGSARIALPSPHQGKSGGQWLAYGTFQFEDQAPVAATGLTRKLRKP